MESSSAFARATQLLRFTSGWKWTARIAAVGAAFCTLGLFIVLGLFVDLLIHRGRMPAYSELNATVRQEFDREMESASVQSRADLWKQLGPPASAAKEFDTASLPATSSAREWLWRASVYDQLKIRVGDAAAEAYRAGVTSNERGEAPAMGLVAMTVRQHGLTRKLFSWIASWNAWTWRPNENSGVNSAYLAGLTILAIFGAVLRAGLLNLMNFAAATSSLDAATRMRRSVYHHANRMGALSLRSEDDGEPVGVFTSHIEHVHSALYASLTTLFCDSVDLVLLVVFALFLDFWVGLTCILLAAVIILLGGYLAARSRDRARFAARRATSQLALLHESLSMTRLVKSNLMDGFNQTRVERQLADYANASFGKFRGESLFRPFLLFLGTVSAAMALFLAGYAVLHGGVGPGRLTLLAAVLATAYWPLARILEQRRVIRRGRESAVPIFEFLDRPGEVGQAVGAEFLSGVAKSIEFRKISLREPGSSRLLLNEIDLKIPAGKRVAIVGPDDAEKHAMIYLLVRFLDSTTGEVRVDDKNLRWVTLESLRAQVGLVMWESTVFNDTVANNIGCGDPSVTLPQIIECAKLAHAHQFIQRLPYGYETPIGSLGTTLRASERFRIALARAILKDPSVYVIEEPRTPFDEERKGLIDDTLARVLPGKTVIFLAHRISTIRSCDVVYLIHKGQVEAAGEHRELLARNDLYKHLHYLEFNEFAEKV